MNRLENTLAEFGSKPGISRIHISQHGPSTFRLASGALLTVEPGRRNKADQILVYLAQPLRFDAERLVRRALEKVHFSNGGPYAIRLGVVGEGAKTNLLMLISLPERDVTPQTLSHFADYISQWFFDLL